jgi:hypothetical protein
MFWLPNRSSCDAPIMMCRCPAASTVNTSRNGTQPSTTRLPSSPGASIVASPSVSSRSGSNVSCASRAPSDGMTPIGLARIAPSPRQASAQATTQTSASVGSVMM